MPSMRSIAACALACAAARAQEGGVSVGADGSLSLADSRVCPNRANSHLDAGFEGVEQAECEALGACWDPTSPAAYCYPLGERMRTVVLYTAEDKINTGVWTEYGGAPPQHAELRWGNKGVSVEKTCPVSCRFTDEQSWLDRADAVLVETVNFEKFGVWTGEMPLPQHVRPHALAAVQATLAPDLPLLGLFGYEHTSYAPHLALGGEATGAFHFSATHSRASTLPVTLVCPWGQPVAHFLAPPPPKTPGHAVAYFSEHGEDPSHSALVEGLLAAAGSEGVHAFAHRANAELPEQLARPEAGLADKLALIGTYRFLLITTPTTEADFLSPELSHALQAGTVPVYFGAENIDEYAPPGGWVDGRGFASGADLWAYLEAFSGESEEATAAYAGFFAWKAGAARAAAEEAKRLGDSILLGTGQGVDPHACAEEAGSGGGEDEAAARWWRCFRKHLDHCVYYAECRICKFVTENT
jgi:hypothetical protein